MKKVLGKGLSAILTDFQERGVSSAAIAPAREAGSGFRGRVEGDDSEAVRAMASGRVVLDVPLKIIDVNPRQPRHHFDTQKLEELSKSVSQEGVMQPILLVKKGDRYEIVAGERRYKACLKAGFDTIPAILTDVDEVESLKLALIENIQRDDLSPMEEALAFRVMIEEFGWTQEELGAYLGRDRSTVSNTLRLLQLPEEVQGMLAGGELSAGHVRALIKLERGDCLQLARHIKGRHLSVRQAERLAQLRKRTPGGDAKTATVQDPVIRAITETMENRIGLPVKLHYRNGKGKLLIPFGSDGELERIMQSLGVSLDGDL
jgi:ParB family transcriptional regulator, chromosome partitioning protein